MQITMSSDPRLSAATLTLDDFLGTIQDEGDASMTDSVIESLRENPEWLQFDEHELLRPQHGYKLRYNVPNDSHCAYLLFHGEMVGLFHETDSLIVHSEHWGNGLGKELVLAAFAQRRWTSPSRKATAAGRKALEDAHKLARALQLEWRMAALAE